MLYFYFLSFLAVLALLFAVVVFIRTSSAAAVLLNMLLLVHQDIGSTLRGELSGTDGEHVGPTTEVIGEQQDVGVASWRDREGQH